MKDLAKSGAAYCFQFDLQSTKLLPRMSTAKSFYKSKIIMHNMTFYNVFNQDTMNYWFSEVDSSSEASTFTSIIMKYLEDNVTEKKSVYLITDGSAAQNRNAVLSSALLRFATKKKVSSNKHLHNFQAEV